MTTLDYALEYIRQGWSVIPLAPRSKAPATKIATYLAGEERITEETAARWWGPGQDYGIGIVTGRPSGLVVIDVDPRNGGDLSDISQRVNTGCRAITGGDGGHFFCRYPADGAIACGKTDVPGVDRKADGGYVVAAPSIHPNGRPYAWYQRDEVGPLPEWALTRTTMPQDGAESPSEPWVASTLGTPRDCLPGAQEETLTRLCWWAARNLAPDIADAVLWAWLAAVPLGNPHDPWTPEHLTSRLERAYEKRPADPGTAGPIVDDRPAPVSIFRPVCDLDFPDQAWVVEDFAAPGAFTEIIGKVKKGKSTLTYQLIDAVRKGEPFLGRTTVQSGVVLMTEQMGTSLKMTLERAGLLGAPNVFVCGKGDIVAVGGWERAIRAAIAVATARNCKLIVVDTLSRLAGLGGEAENQSGAVSILDPFTLAKAEGISCIFVRHARKGMSGEHDEIADAARGSSAITGDMDIVLRLTSCDDDYRCLSWESRITDDPEDVYLEYQDGTYAVVDKPTGKRERQDSEDLRLLGEAVKKVGLVRNSLAKELGWGRSKTARILELHRTFGQHGPSAKPPEDE